MAKIPRCAIGEFPPVYRIAVKHGNGDAIPGKQKSRY
jgi:hypothetical protein